MVPPERARAVVEVEPNHAACYWQVISERLTQLGAQGSRLEVSVVDKASVQGTGAQLVLLEMSSTDLDQAMLDAAIRQARPACAPRARVVESGRGLDAGPLPAAVEWHTVVAPLTPQPSVTVSAPLSGRHDQTVHAPLVPVSAARPEPPVDAEASRGSGLETRRAASTNLRPLALGMLLVLIAVTIIIVGLRAAAPS
jgi:hypothetical protein